MNEPIIRNNGKELIVKLDTEWLAHNNFSFTSKPLHTVFPRYYSKKNGKSELSREDKRRIRHRINEKL